MAASAASAAGIAALALMAVVLGYVVISQQDLNKLMDENQGLTAKLDAQVESAVVSQAALAQLNLDIQALAAALDQQREALSASQGDLDKLSEASQGLSTKLDAQEQTLTSALDQQSSALSTKLDAQATALAATQDSLETLRNDNESLAPTLGDQSDALAAVRVTLSTLQQENQNLASQVEEQGDLLTARISEQDEILAGSQKDIEDLGAQNLVLAATATNQQIFTYLQALPVTNKYVLKATENAPGTFGMLVTNVANNWGVAVLLGVEPLDPGTVYDLWLEKDGVATHGWFIKSVDPDSKFGQVYAKNFPTPVNQFDRLFVTVEPEGGSPAPTGPELLSGTIN